MPFPRLPTALLLSLLAVSLGAQDKSSGDSKGQKVIQSPDQQADEKTESEGFSKADGAPSKSDPQPARPVGSRGYCRLDGSVQPKRMMPGQTGKLLVTMVMEGDAVMTAPAGLSVTGIGTSMVIGGWSVLPPTRGTVAKAFVGQPVYDNWAVIEADVTMPAEAKLGEQRHAMLEVEFDLNEGASGKPIGHFKERVHVQCEVGIAPNPLVTATLGTGSAIRQPGPASGGQPDPSGDNTGDVVPATAATLSPQKGYLAEPATPVAQTPTAAPHGGQQPPVDESPSLLLYAAGCGVLMVALLLLLLRRR